MAALQEVLSDSGTCDLELPVAPNCNASRQVESPTSLFRQDIASKSSPATVHSKSDGKGTVSL